MRLRGGSSARNKCKKDAGTHAHAAGRTVPRLALPIANAACAPYRMQLIYLMRLRGARSQSKSHGRS